MGRVHPRRHLGKVPQRPHDRVEEIIGFRDVLEGILTAQIRAIHSSAVAADCQQASRFYAVDGHFRILAEFPASHRPQNQHDPIDLIRREYVRLLQRRAKAAVALYGEVLNYRHGKQIQIPGFAGGYRVLPRHGPGDGSGADGSLRCRQIHIVPGVSAHADPLGLGDQPVDGGRGFVREGPFPHRGQPDVDPVALVQHKAVGGGHLRAFRASVQGAEIDRCGFIAGGIGGFCRRCGMIVRHGRVDGDGAGGIHVPEPVGVDGRVAVEHRIGGNAAPALRLRKPAHKGVTRPGGRGQAGQLAARCRHHAFRGNVAAVGIKGDRVRLTVVDDRGVLQALVALRDADLGPLLGRARVKHRAERRTVIERVIINVVKRNGHHNGLQLFAAGKRVGRNSRNGAHQRHFFQIGATLENPLAHFHSA